MPTDPTVLSHTKCCMEVLIKSPLRFCEFYLSVFIIIPHWIFRLIFRFASKRSKTIPHFQSGLRNYLSFTSLSALTYKSGSSGDVFLQFLTMFWNFKSLKLSIFSAFSPPMSQHAEPWYSALLQFLNWCLLHLSSPFTMFIYPCPLSYIWSLS